MLKQHASPRPAWWNEVGEMPLITRHNLQLVAHRGYMKHYPENSWSGVKAALDVGAEWLECDIQMCRPGHFILLHDGDFTRTAGDLRSPFGISDLELEQISIHEPGRLGTRFQGEPVIRLPELMKRLQAFPDVRIMLEIKQESLDKWGVQAVMSSLLKILQPYPEQAVVISFSLPALQFAKTHGSLELGWVLRHYNPSSLIQASALAPEFLIINHTWLPDTGNLARGPWRWMLYDITDPELAIVWHQRGASLIETLNIGAMLQKIPSRRMPGG